VFNASANRVGAREYPLFRENRKTHASRKIYHLNIYLTPICPRPARMSGRPCRRA